MLYNMKELLRVAYKNQFAVGSFNVANSEFVKIVLRAAEEQNSPAIIQIHPNEIDLITDEFVAYVREAAHRAKVPVVIHLDHGASIRDCLRAIRNGYTSVMIDASRLSFEENVALTKRVVKLAHLLDVSVEAELGTIGSNDNSSEGGSDDILYTDPQQAAEFVSQTDVDTLAVAIGTSHGIYPQTKDHSIKIERLKEIHSAVDIPLVLHGGSDNPDNEIEATTKYGIAKINLSTDMKNTFFKQLRVTLQNNPTAYEPDQIMPEATHAAIELVKHKMTLFGSTGKAPLYHLGT